MPKKIVKEVIRRPVRRVKDVELLAKRIAEHGPLDDPWESDEDVEGMCDAIDAPDWQALNPMVVLAADIRASTLLMKEAVSLREYADLISGFCTTSSRDFVRKQGGWFDKFTGDGFIAYWPVEEEENPLPSENAALTAAIEGLTRFEERTLPGFRKNSYSFPAEVGISYGIDEGPARLAWVAEDLTVLGRPVVGAVRMLESAHPSEIVCNVQLGEALMRKKRRLDGYNVQARLENRKTKDYVQAVYPLEFKRVKG